MTLHRLFWEMLEFYSSEEVRGDLLGRGHRKLKGDLLSLFGMKKKAQFYRVFTFALPTTLKQAKVLSETQKEGDRKTRRDKDGSYHARTSNDLSGQCGLKAILTYVQDVVPTIMSSASENKDVVQAWHDLSDVCNSISCLVCLQRPRSVRFSCGHVFCCTQCAVHLRNCAVCRLPASSKSRVYMFPPLIDDTVQDT